VRKAEGEDHGKERHNPNKKLPNVYSDEYVYHPAFLFYNFKHKSRKEEDSCDDEQWTVANHLLVIR
jgi:hypothetical protein